RTTAVGPIRRPSVRTSVRTLGGGGLKQPVVHRRPQGASSRVSRLPCSSTSRAVGSQSRAAATESPKIVTCCSGALLWARDFPASADAASAQARTTAESRATSRPTASRIGRNRDGGKRDLRSQNDFESGASSRRTAEPEAALDRGCARPHVPQPLAGAGRLSGEALAVVRDRDVALAGEAAPDHDLRPRRARVPPNVAQAFLDDPEDLDLLVRGEPDVRVDLELHLEAPVGGQELDVAAQGGVEGRGTARRREGEDREARLLLRERRRLLEPRRDLLHRAARLEHLRVRRKREQVLGETVVDLPRDACALLGDGAAELRGADRAPGSDEDDGEG